MKELGQLLEGALGGKLISEFMTETRKVLVFHSDEGKDWGI